MTTTRHTPLPFGGPLTSAAMESPLSQLDTAIVAAEAALTAEAGARAAAVSAGDTVLGARLDAIIIDSGTSDAETIDARGGYATLGAKVRGSKFDVRDYGPMGTADDSATIRTTIDAAYTAGGGEVTVPAGTYIADGLILKNKVWVCGAGKDVTIIQAPAASASEGVFLLDVGPVTCSGLRGLQVLGNGNAGQHGIYFQSVGIAGPPYHGGWWHGGLRSVGVYGFSGHAIWLRGGNDDSLLPHQYIVFDDVSAYGLTDTGRALYATGQVEHFDCLNGEFGGAGRVLGTANTSCVYLRRHVNDSDVVDGDKHASTTNFRGTSFGASVAGVYIDRGYPITFDGCYFEDLDKGIESSASALLVEVKGSLFAEVGQAHAVLGSGFVAKAGAGCLLNVHDCVIDISAVGGVDKHFVAGVFAHNNYYNGTMVPLMQATGQFGVVGGSVTTGYLTTALLGGDGASINAIVSNLETGSTLYLQGAYPSGFAVSTGGNIGLGGFTSPVAVPWGSTAMFVKFDLGAEWVLMSVTGA